MAERLLREAAMTPAIHRWLRGRGCVPFTEIGLWYSPIDHVGLGVCGAESIAVEAKVCLSWKVLRQALLDQLAVPYCYCAILSRPQAKGMDFCRRHRIGILRIEDGQATEVLRARRAKINPYHVERLEYALSHSTSGGVGGLPCLRGEGLAQDCARRIEAYRAEHPKATWAEIWTNVPNHYSSAASMRSAQSMLAQRLRER